MVQRKMVQVQHPLDKKLQNLKTVIGYIKKVRAHLMCQIKGLVVAVLVWDEH